MELLFSGIKDKSPDGRPDMGAFGFGESSKIPDRVVW